MVVVAGMLALLVCRWRVGGVSVVRFPNGNDVNDAEWVGYDAVSM